MMRSPRAPDRDWSRLGSVRRLRLPVPTPALFNKVKGDKETIIGLSSESDSATCHKLRSLISFICFSKSVFDIPKPHQGSQFNYRSFLSTSVCEVSNFLWDFNLIVWIIQICLAPKENLKFRISPFFCQHPRRQHHQRPLILCIFISLLQQDSVFVFIFGVIARDWWLV